MRTCAWGARGPDSRPAQRGGGRGSRRRGRRRMGPARGLGGTGADPGGGCGRPGAGLQGARRPEAFRGRVRRGGFRQGRPGKRPGAEPGLRPAAGRAGTEAVRVWGTSGAPRGGAGACSPGGCRGPGRPSWGVDGPAGIRALQGRSGGFARPRGGIPGFGGRRYGTVHTEGSRSCRRRSDTPLPPSPGNTDTCHQEPRSMKRSPRRAAIRSGVRGLPAVRTVPGRAAGAVFGYECAGRMSNGQSAAAGDPASAPSPAIPKSIPSTLALSASMEFPIRATDRSIDSIRISMRATLFPSSPCSDRTPKKQATIKAPIRMTAVTSTPIRT